MFWLGFRLCLTEYYAWQHLWTSPNETFPITLKFKFPSLFKANPHRHRDENWRHQSKKMKKTVMERELHHCGKLKITLAHCCVEKFKLHKFLLHEQHDQLASGPAYTSLKVPRRCFYLSNISVHCQRRHKHRVPKWTATNFRRCHRHRHSKNQ